MVHTYGLTHINLVVRDVARSLRFYGQVFGVEEYGLADGLVHTRTPGCHDVITFDEHSEGPGWVTRYRAFRLPSCFARRHRRGSRRSRARRGQIVTPRRIQPRIPIRLCSRPGRLRSRNLV
jgi:catechol 2,3-dioxygenase-like lactoylglutathione lyase family enzyme